MTTNFAAASLQDLAANPLAVEYYHQHLDLVCDDAAMAWLAKQGVSHAARLAAGNLGLSEVETARDGLYQPSPHNGRRAFITPVYGPVRPLEVAVIDPDAATPIDLVAWHMDQPNRWWLRRGTAVLLGEIEIVYAETYGEPIRIYRTPLDWLKAGGEGVVILDWTEAWFHLRGLKLGAEDHQHGEELQRRLRPPWSKGPQILVPRKAAA